MHYSSPPSSKKPEDTNYKPFSRLFNADFFNERNKPIGHAWIAILPLATFFLLVLAFYFRIVGFIAGVAALMVLFSRNEARVPNYLKLLKWSLIGTLIVPVIALVCGFIFQKDIVASGLFDWVTGHSLLNTSLDRMVQILLGAKLENSEWLTRNVKQAPAWASISQPFFISAISGLIYCSAIVPALLYFCPRTDGMNNDEYVEKIAVLFGLTVLVAAFSFVWLFDGALIGTPSRQVFSFSGWIAIEIYWLISTVFFVAAQHLVFSIRTLRNSTS